jgi:predicted nucleic acid-binding protein
LSSIFDLDAALRRVRPDRRLGRLTHRAAISYLPDDIDPTTIGPVLLDTCVFIDNGRDRLPLGAKRLLAARGLIHVSSVTGLELSYAFGRLDPTDARTSRSLRYVRDALDAAPSHRVITAMPADHAVAGVLAGTLTRTQGLDREGRGKLLFDCLIFASARRNGLTVLTANSKDFDLLQQLVPDTKVALYQPVNRVAASTSGPQPPRGSG